MNARRGIRCAVALAMVLAAAGIGRAQAQAQAQAPVPPGRSPMSLAIDSVRTLADVGQYDDAEQVARRYLPGPGGQEMLTTLGDVLLARGRLAPAESLFMRAVAGRATDSLTAAVRLAELHWNRGDRELATREFDRFTDIYNRSAATLTSQQFVAVAIACKYLGAADPQRFKDALKAYDRAVVADRRNVDARTALGELFTSKYNGADAQAMFATALSLRPNDPRALVGEARRLSADGQPGADSLIARALERNPSYVPALVLRAREALDVERFDDAQRAIDRALAVNPASAEALAVAAAIKYVVGDQRGFETLRDRARALYPHSGEFLATMADAAGRIRRYDAAADFARQAVAIDSLQWRARGLLGMNLLRRGRIAEARAMLDTSFKGDPYDVWIKNTLDLLDTFVNYDSTSTAHATFMIEKTESALLTLYLGGLIDDAWQQFAARYGWTPSGPVRIEVYRSQADFSVRTIGLTGIGALGVSFGPVLAFDSPAAKDAGPFNWGSTAWHELAHTFTLGATDHRIPRWFSEGLSVWEEHRARRGWGFGVTPDFLAALKDGKLVPVSRMNDGFMRPAYPEQVIFSYYQASLICDWIVAAKGEQALVAMLREYKAGRTTAEVFTRVLGTDLAAFDVTFDAWMKNRFKGAEPVSTDALLIKARTVLAAGQASEAIATLWTAVYQDATSLPAHMALANALEAATGSSRLTEVADALERSIYIEPFDIAVHQRLAVLYSTLGNRAKLIRERRAIVALNPVDQADAWYQLAMAQFAAGDAAGARVSVIRSLEVAPNFAKAQDLLLTLVDGNGRQP